MKVGSTARREYFGVMQQPVEESSEFSFAIMNGQCRVTDDAICFDYDEGWKRLERIFGEPSPRRTVILGLVIGLPLLLLAFTMFMFGFWLQIATPLIFGLVFTLGPLLAFQDETLVYPDIIPRSAIQNFVGIPPQKKRLGYFTIEFLSDGQFQKTSFVLPLGDSPRANLRRRLEAFQAVEAAFVEAGLIRQSV